MSAVYITPATRGSSTLRCFREGEEAHTMAFDLGGVGGGAAHSTKALLLASIVASELPGVDEIYVSSDRLVATVRAAAEGAGGEEAGDYFNDRMAGERASVDLPDDLIDAAGRFAARIAGGSLRLRSRRASKFPAPLG